jgi:hypothetical protein
VLSLVGVAPATAALHRAAVAGCVERGAIVQLDHALLIESLKVADHLGDQPGKLPRDVSDILL